MQSGDVFLWSNFPFPRYDNVIKPRWFVYIGDTGILKTPPVAFLLTATTNTASIDPGGIKHGHAVCQYHPHNSPFAQECILDVDEGPYPVELSKIQGNIDIEHKGALTEQQMRELYNKMFRSRYFNKAVMRDIHRSFNNVGITSLKMP